MSGVVGSNIRARREQLGLSQAKLSKLANVSQSAISDIENPEVTKSPSIDTLQKIAAAMDTTISRLCGEDTQNEKKPAEISGARERLVNLLVSVPEDQAQEVADLVAAFLSVRKRE